MSNQVIFPNTDDDLFIQYNNFLLKKSNDYLLKTRFNLGKFDLDFFTLNRLSNILCNQDNCNIDKDLLLEKIQILIIKNT